MTCELFISSFIRDHMWIWIALSLDLPDTWVNSTIIHTPSSLNVIKLYTCLEPSLLLPISLKQEVKTWLNLRSSIVLYHYKLSTSSVLIDAEDIPWSCGCFILSLTMPEYMIPLLCRWRISLHLVEVPCYCCNKEKEKARKQIKEGIMCGCLYTQPACTHHFLPVDLLSCSTSLSSTTSSFSLKWNKLLDDRHYDHVV